MIPEVEVQENQSTQFDSDQKFQEIVSTLDFENLENHLHINDNPYHINGIRYTATKHEAIESLAHLSFKLKDNMISYDTIISDDASGRLVGLYLWKQIKIQKANSGLSPKTTFYGVATGVNTYERQEEAVKKFIIAKKKKNNFGKTLLVTENIRHGNGIIPIAEFLDHEGIDFDIASLSAENTFLDSNNSKYPDDIWKWLKSKVIYGNKSASGLLFYHRPENGLIKMPPLKEKPLTQAHAQKNPGATQLIINRARTDMEYLAQNILQAIE